MDYISFKRHLHRADLTVREFAELVGMNNRSVTNYRKGNRVPNHLAALAVLMDAMEGGGLDFRTLLKDLDAEPKKTRGSGRRGVFGGAAVKPQAANDSKETDKSRT